jgi:hypothetical protein
MARRRRAVELFSLSFLDCICCGFGAMLLLFVLLIGRSSGASQQVVADIKQTINQLKAQIELEQKETGELRNRLMIQDQRLGLEISNRDVTKHDLTDMQDELALLLQQRSSLKEELDRLLGDKKNVPKQDETAPIPIPNPQRRQYLTGFNFEGSYIVFMLEASGGMLGYTVDDALAKVALPDDQKRKQEKWRRAITAMHWIIANLGPKQGYQILVFNKEAKPLLPDRETEWLEPLNRETTTAVIKKLEEIVPQGGANLERAFIEVRTTFPLVDTVVLITDSLPTQSDSMPYGSSSDDRDREGFFRAAIKEIPRQTPINTILFPMSGDPACPYLFWQLAEATKGSLISPAPSWPDI